MDKSCSAMRSASTTMFADSISSACFAVYGLALVSRIICKWPDVEIAARFTSRYSHFSIIFHSFVSIVSRPAPCVGTVFLSSLSFFDVVLPFLPNLGVLLWGIRVGGSEMEVRRGDREEEGHNARKFRTIKLTKTISHGFLTYFDKVKTKKGAFLPVFIL